jgi:outer membrane protein OmpA-like peptidoglycan-associated protein
MSSKSIILGAAVAILTGPAVASDEQVRGEGALGELHFQFDSAALMDGAPSTLDNIVSFASANPAAKIVLDAHTDPVGASDYNVKLAIRRAESVRERLTELGVANDRIVFAIYGEDGERRTRHADDRRVTIWSTPEPLAKVIDQTFAASGNAVTWHQPQTVAQIEGTTEVATR